MPEIKFQHHIYIYIFNKSNAVLGPLITENIIELPAHYTAGNVEIQNPFTSLITNRQHLNRNKCNQPSVSQTTRRQNIWFQVKEV